jgi:hypothetical protein
MNQTLRIGDRIRLIEMPDDPDPIPVGEIGTVTGISHHEDGDDLWHQVDVEWDHGRALMLTLPPDRIEIFSSGKESLGEV